MFWWLKFKCIYLFAGELIETDCGRNDQHTLGRTPTCLIYSQTQSTCLNSTASCSFVASISEAFSSRYAIEVSLLRDRGEEVLMGYKSETHLLVCATPLLHHDVRVCLQRWHVVYILLPISADATGSCPQRGPDTVAFSRGRDGRHDRSSSKRRRSLPCLYTSPPKQEAWIDSLAHSTPLKYSQCELPFLRKGKRNLNKLSYHNTTQHNTTQHNTHPFEVSPGPPVPSVFIHPHQLDFIFIPLNN